MTAPPPLPSWANRPTPGPPAPGSPADQLLAAFIGPRWETYRRKFRPFFEDARFTPTWNWAAALSPLLGGPFWFVYRKLYVPALAFWLLPSLVMGLLWQGQAVSVQEVLAPARSPRAQEFLLMVSGVQLSTMILAGGTANFLLFRRAQAALRVVTARAGGGDAAIALLARVGRVNRGGVLIVVAFIAVMIAMSQLGVVAPAPR